MKPDPRAASAPADGDSANSERHLREKEALEQRIEALLAALSEGVVIVDADGVVTSMNDAAETILGVRRKHMRGAVLLALPWQAFEANGLPMERTAHPIIVALRSG